MVNINLKSIKKESINSVFSVIAAGEDVSRAYIADKTGLSLMTVGKVVDMLIEKNIIVQSKQVKHEVGRRAGLVNLNNDNRMAIFDLSTYNFKLNIFDSAINFKDSYTYSYDSARSFEQNFTAFLQEAKNFISINIKKDRFIGAALSLPGPYYEENDFSINTRIVELNKLPLKNTFVREFGYEPAVIAENVKLGAVSHIRATEEYRSKIILYLHIGEGVAGAISINGEIIHGAGGISGEIGQMNMDYAPDGMNIESYVKSPDFSKESKIKALTRVIHDLSWFIAPHTVIVDSEDEMYEITTESIAKSYAGEVREIFPEVVSIVADINNAYIGAGLLLRDKWLEGILN